VAAEAGQIVSWIDMVMDRHGTIKLAANATGRLRKALTEIPANDLPDYEAARQLAWAYVVFSEELGWKPGTLEVEQRRKYAERLDGLSKRLNGTLMLALPSGRDRQILSELADSLKKLSNYDPRKFAKEFRALGQNP
jgi:hypothetical protein